MRPNFASAPRRAGRRCAARMRGGAKTSAARVRSATVARNLGLHGKLRRYPGPRPRSRELSTVCARRFCDQHEMSLQTATGRSLPYEMVRTREPLMPFWARKLRTVVARRAPSAMLYSRVPRSSAWPSMVIVYCGYCCSHCACFCRVAVASGVRSRAVGGEVDDVADVDAEVALRAGRHRAVLPPVSCELGCVLVVGAGGEPAHPEHDGERRVARASQVEAAMKVPFVTTRHSTSRAGDSSRLKCRVIRPLVRKCGRHGLGANASRSHN